MKSVPRGDDTSKVEVSGISPHGIWLYLGDCEAFLPFTEFPWFREATIADVLHVERPQSHHLYWPALDVDLAVESILDPGKFPLISRDRPSKLPERQTRATRLKSTAPRRRAPRQR